MPRKIKELLLPRPLSWSGMVLLEKDEEAWIAKYLDGKDIDFSNDGMRFGKKLAEHLEEETDDLEMQVISKQLPTLDKQEHKIGCEIQNGNLQKIPLTGILDRASKSLNKIREVKTGQGEAWTQQKANNHGQLHFYSVIIHRLKRKIPQIWLDWVQTEKVEGGVCFTGQVKSFEVKLNLLDLAKMRRRIIKNATRIDFLTRQHIKQI